MSISKAITVSIEAKIHLIRGQKVMLDEDLAELYNVTVKRLNEQIRRNKQRFPDDFMFQLTDSEHHSLRSQNATLEKQSSGRGRYRKYLPYAFTEQGIAMLSGVLNSPRAIQVNIEIMRAFVKIRHILSANKNLWRKIEELESKYDQQFQVVFDALRGLMIEEEKPKRRMGFHSE